MKVSILNTWCILMSEAVTVPSLTVMTSVSEESLARGTRHARAHAHTHTYTHTHTHTCVSPVLNFFKEFGNKNRLDLYCATPLTRLTDKSDISFSTAAWTDLVRCVGTHSDESNGHHLEYSLTLVHADLWRWLVGSLKVRVTRQWFSTVAAVAQNYFDRATRSAYNASVVAIHGWSFFAVLCGMLGV